MECPKNNPNVHTSYIRGIGLSHKLCAFGSQTNDHLYSRNFLSHIRNSLQGSPTGIFLKLRQISTSL